MMRVTDDDLDPRARAAETKKRRTRERAINATLDLFTLDAVKDRRDMPTIEQIAEEGDIGVATIYTHFSTKYGLYRASLDLLFESLIRPIRIAKDLGAYDPPDMRSEIISYVCKVVAVAHNYRYLVAAYIQAFFEAKLYDAPGDNKISQPVQPGLLELISYGQKGLSIQYSTDTNAVRYHMDMLLLLICDNNYHTPNRAVIVAQRVLIELLPEIDSSVKSEDFQVIRNQVARVMLAGSH